MRSFRGKKALVTGAASGIGRAIAIALAREGASLRLLDIDEAGLSNTRNDVTGLGADAATIACDLADPRQIADSVDSLRSAGGELHILINAAGIAHHGPMHLMSDDHWNRVIAVNLLAPIQLTRELFSMLTRQDEAHILNLCSIAGLVPLARVAAYQTSKFGLVGFTQALRVEYARPGFGVTCLCPGFVRTPLLENLGKPGKGGEAMRPPRWMCISAERVAQRAMTAMKRNEGLVVLSPVARMAWWVWRHGPGPFEWLMRDGWRSRGKLPAGELRRMEDARGEGAGPEA
jgi:3-oxoacyl-[acyl-carrier protein] reductase